jgi:hypothetical protein
MPRPRFSKLPKSVEEAAEWYMRYISPLSLVAAFIIDTFFLLRRVDTPLTSFVLFFYLTVAALIILVISLVQTGRWRTPWLITIMPFLPVASQFAFGGLFIAFLSLYSRSAAFGLTWISVLALAALLIANERFVRFYMRFPFQVAMLFTVLFSLLIFYLPLVFRTIGPWMFVASGVASLCIIAAFLRLQYYFTPELVRENLTAIARSIAAIFITFNVLYFTNAIPPLPLALKEAGVYHNISKFGNEYQLLVESAPWYQEYLPHKTVFHKNPGESAYTYTAIFAPAGLATTVIHEWQHYDEGRNSWVTEETIAFPILGGREGGYRGYSVKSDPAPGKWRVNVKIDFGQVIGRVSFEVKEILNPPVLETVTR